MAHADRQFTPRSFQAMINAWPPFVAQCVRVTEIAEDWSWVEVGMELTPENANFFGTAWGGTLFSMLDPFLPILIERQLGAGYAVWDRTAEIDFLRPGRSAISSRVELPAEVIEEIRVATADGEKLLRWFETPLLDDAGHVVAISDGRSTSAGPAEPQQRSRSPGCILGGSARPAASDVTHVELPAQLA